MLDKSSTNQTSIVKKRSANENKGDFYHWVEDHARKLATSMRVAIAHLGKGVHWVDRIINIIIIQPLHITIEGVITNLNITKCVMSLLDQPRKYFF